MDIENPIVVVIIIISIIVVSYIFYKLSSKKSINLSPKNTKDNKGEGFKEGKDFYIYNYYKIPIDVYIVPQGDDISDNSIKAFEPVLMASNVPSGKRKGVQLDMIQKYIKNGSIVSVRGLGLGTSEITYDKPNSTPNQPGVLIGESTLNLPPNKIIRHLHLGMVSGHDDIYMSGEITKSPLGTSLPRVRIVNMT